MKRKGYIILIVFLILLISAKFFFIRRANDDVHLKVDLIKKELKTMGYRPVWFMISGKRDTFLTDISYNNVKTKKGKSYHLTGQAIDVEVLDIDGDWDFDEKDIVLIEKANAIVEQNNPNLIGALGTYRGPDSDWLEWRQVHFDTRGTKKRYNYLIQKKK
jgi:hypothetical protein